MQRLHVFLDRSQRRATSLIVVGSCIAAGLEIVGIGFIPAFVALLLEPDRVLGRMPNGNWLQLLGREDYARFVLLSGGALTAVFVAKNVYVLALNYWENRVVENIKATTACRLFRAYLESPYSLHLRRNPAELIRNMVNESGYAAEFISGGIRLLREALVLVVVMLLLLFVDPVVSLAVFVLLASASVTFSLAVRSSLSRRGAAGQEHWSRQVKIVSQTFGSIKEVKILGRERYFLSSFEHEVDELRKNSVYYGVVSTMPRLFLEVLAVMAVLLVAASFVLRGRPVHDMLPILALLAVAVVRLVPAFGVINSSLSMMRYRRQAYDLVCSELASLERPHDELLRRDERAPASKGIIGAIEIENVRYRYPESDSDALSEVSIHLSRGEVVGFIGASGGGKSTLINVILGLLQPTAGSVQVNGRDIHEDLSAWHSQVGYVPQDVFLLDDTISRNIAFGVPDSQLDRDALSAAVKAAHVDAFLSQLPEGLDTTVGNDGVRLSGGQRQRIGVARALYNNPSVLVLDEATSALDRETEQQIVAAINELRGERIILMIAHRLTTVQNCDRLYVLEDGRIKDTGTFDELSVRHPGMGLVKVAELDDRAAQAGSSAGR